MVGGGHASWALELESAAHLVLSSPGGAISLVPLGPNETAYLEANGPRLEDLNVDIRTAEDLEVRIEGHLQPSGGEGTSLTLHIPADLPARISSEAGSIDVDGMTACDLTLSLGAGRITLRDVHGRLRLVAGAGQISGYAVGGQLDVDLNAGTLVLEILDLMAGEHTIRLAAGSAQLALAPELAVQVSANVGRGEVVNDYPAGPLTRETSVNISADVGVVHVNALGTPAVTPLPLLAPRPLAAGDGDRSASFAQADP
jgi:hypothetical protein